MTSQEKTGLSRALEELMHKNLNAEEIAILEEAALHMTHRVLRSNGSTRSRLLALTEKFGANTSPARREAIFGSGLATCPPGRKNPCGKSTGQS